MINVDLDKSKAIRLRARVKESSVSKVMIFNDESGNPVDIRDFDFELIVYKSVGSTLKFFTLTIGDGLSVQGDDNNQLVVEISATRARQKADTYFFRLYSVSEDHTWLNGPFQFHNGEFDSDFEETTITVGGEQDINIEIPGGGGLVLAIDGGTPDSIYTNLPSVDGGTP